MRSLPKVGVKRPYLCETDLFFDKLNFITFTEEVIEAFINLINKYKNGDKITIQQRKCLDTVLSPNFYNKKKNTFYVQGYLIDSLFDLNDKENLHTIENKLLSNQEMNMTDTQLKNFKKSNKLSNLTKITSVDNKNISLGVIHSTGNDYDPRIFFEIDMPGINKTTINGINISYAIPLMDNCLDYIISNTTLGTDKTSGNFRLYRATPPPVELRYEYKNSRYSWDNANLSKFDYKPITESDYQILVAEKEFPRIKKKGEMYSNPDNYVNSMDTLIPGHIYVVTEIKNALADPDRAPEGYNYLAQFLYLGELNTKDKPDNQWNYTKESSYLYNSFGYVPVYRDERVDRNGMFELNSFHGGPKDYICDKKLKVFVNIGQLAKFKTPTTYAIEEEKLNTCDKFVDTFTGDTIPDILRRVVNWCNNLKRNSSGDWLTNYLNVMVHSSYSDRCSSLISTNSPAMITVVDKNFMSKSYHSSSVNVPSFIDLGELFDGSKFDFTEFFNKITVKTLEVCKEVGLDFYTTTDSLVDTMTATTKTSRRFTYQNLPYLSWVTPELYNTNLEVKKAVLESLKCGIKDVADLIMFAIPKLWEYENSLYHYGIPPKYYNRTSHFVKNELQKRDNFSKIMDTFIYNRDVFSNDSCGNLRSIIRLAHDSMLNSSNYNVNSDYVTGVIIPLSNKEACDKFCDMILNLNKVWKDIRSDWDKKGYYTSNKGDSQRFSDFVKDLRTSLPELNTAVNTYYNWFVDYIYDEYKNSGLYKNSELMWIDKFDIKKEDLHNIVLSN